MNRTIRSLTAGLAAITLLSGCGPAANGSRTSAASDQSSTSSADTAETPSQTEPSQTEASPEPVTPDLPAPTTVKPKPPVAGTALAAVAKLTVKGRAPKTGYTHDQFGQAWFDTDRNGCDTRNDILRRDLKSKQMQNSCKVLAGTLSPDPYTGHLYPVRLRRCQRG